MCVCICGGGVVHDNVKSALLTGCLKVARTAGVRVGLRPQNRAYRFKLGYLRALLCAACSARLFCQLRVDLNTSHLNTFEYKDRK